MKAGILFFRVSLLAISIFGLMMTSPALSEVAPKTVSAQPKGESRTLLDALNAIEKRHGITFFLDEAIPVDRQVEPVPDSAAVEASLHQLLLGYDYFLQFSPDAESGVNTLKRVWVFPRAGAEDIELVSREEFIRARDCPDSDANRPWLESIQASPDGGDQMISEILASSDETNRNQVLDAAQRSEIFIPRRRLEDLLRNDPSEDIRAKAFSLLKMHPASNPEEERAILDLALTDPSPLIQEMARQYQEQQTIFSDENAIRAIGAGRQD